jgi:APA family basic amino acid/polyamine antiporter
VALATIVAVTLVNCMAVTVTGGLSVVLSGLKVAIVAAIGVGTFVFASGDWGNFAMTASGGACEGVSEAARGGVTGFGAAMLGALWAYDGWSNVTMLAGEVKDPKRNLPRALIGGIGLVLVLYLVINTAYFYVLTPNEVQSVSAVSSVAAETVRRYLGSLAVSLIAASMLVSTLGSFHSTLLAGSRIPYAVAQDGHFPKTMGRLSPRSRVPIGSILVMSAWSCLLTLSGSFDALTDYSMFGSWLFYGLATGAIFVFRKRMPDAERPYRAWGYPVLPALFLVVTAWLLVNTIWTAPTQSLIGLVIVALGLPIHWYYSRRNARLTLPTDASGRATMVGDD